MMASASEEPSGSRVFVVCGRAVESDMLQDAFAPCGTIEHIKLVKEKGVAYVKFDRASSAALAIEQLNGAVLNNGKGPKLKVLLAESPAARGMNQGRQMMEAEISTDPDNTPPRSRLFIVVPKQAEAQQLQDEINRFQDVVYCKTDLVASKGVMFAKFNKASSALSALEQINMQGGVAGYKVKCMLAEPKTKRGRNPDGSPQHPEFVSPLSQAPRMDYGMHGSPMDALKLPGLAHSGMRGMPDYLSNLAAAAAGSPGLNNLSALSNNLGDMQGLGGQGGFSFNMGMGQLNNLSGASPATPNNHAHGISKQRLFVVVHKSVSDDVIARLFRRFPGMEYCDLKKDRATGKSKGYCYVNYSTPDAAYAAVEQLNGAEFPPHSGHRIKVMFAEPLGARPTPGGQQMQASPLVAMSPNTPMGMPRNMSAEMASMQETLSNMSIHRVSSQAELERVMASPVAVNTVARELMFGA